MEKTGLKIQSNEEVWQTLQSNGRVAQIIQHSSAFKDEKLTAEEKIGKLSKILQASSEYGQKGDISPRNVKVLTDLAQRINGSKVFNYAIKVGDHGLINALQYVPLEQDEIVDLIEIAIGGGDGENARKFIHRCEPRFLMILLQKFANKKDLSAICFLLQNTKIKADGYLHYKRMIPLILQSKNYTIKGVLFALEKCIYSSELDVLNELLKCPDIPQNELLRLLDIASYLQLQFEANQDFPPKFKYLGFYDANKSARNKYISENLPERFKNSKEPTYDLLGVESTEVDMEDEFSDILHIRGEAPTKTFKPISCDRTDLIQRLREEVGLRNYEKFKIKSKQDN